MKPVKLTLALQIVALLFVMSGQAAYTVNVNKARELLATGQYEAAIPLLEEVVSDSPDSAEGYFLLGCGRAVVDGL